MHSRFPNKTKEERVAAVTAMSDSQEVSATDTAAAAATSHLAGLGGD